MSSKRLDLLQGTLEHLVLQTLKQRDTMHGFEVLEWIRSTTGGELVIEEGALYPALHRMEKRGWLAAEWGVSPKGRRAKYYRLTKKGRAALAREEAKWGRYVQAVAKLAEG
ncbi:MAG: PadR family transcriptional regulator [Gemmatimonadetes bacterium]|nr:PadR family transcriptional regulator [Gemmatimonadota bacterium]